MHRVIDIDLGDRSKPFRVHEDAYDALGHYLDEARARLTDDPDRAEVLNDLERSIAAKLTERLGAEERVLRLEDVTTVLEAVGPVGSAGPGSEPAAMLVADRTHRRRRLYRIREGQWIAGVCTGLAAYSEIDLDWVRTIFFFLALVTAGAFILVYLVMAFVLPVVPTRAAWTAALDEVA